MKIYQLDDMTNGWFIGKFSPTVLATNDVEVAVKRYKAGESESIHHHKIATEITVVIFGEIKMNGVTYSKGSIIVIEPNNPTDFLALTDVTLSVVKYPGANNDKYLEVPN